MTPTGLADKAAQIAAARPQSVPVEFQGWDGSMRSVSADLVPLNYVADSDATSCKNMHYLPRTRSWKTRLGQTIKFDTLTSGHETTGLLPASWANSPTSSSNGSKCRQLDEFISSSITDGIPTLCALVTRETVASGLDDGRFSTLYVRDQVNNLNYTLGSEFNTTNYPAPGTTQTYKFVPLWHESGDGQISRGIEEYQQRLFLMGSRRMEKVGNWRYFPNRYGTPCRWDEGGAQATEGAELFATSDAVGTPTALTCTTNGTTTLTSAAQFGALSAGMVISGTGIPEGTRVASIATSSSLTMSRAATDSTTTSRNFALSTFWLQSISGGNGQWTIANLQGSLYQNAYQDLATTNPNEDDDMVAINNASAGAFPFNSTLNFGTLSSSFTRWRLRVRCKLTVAYVGTAEFHMTITDSAGTKYTTASQDLASMSVVGSYTDLTFDVGPSNITGTGTANQVVLSMTRTSGTFSQAFRVTRLSVAALSGGGSSASRLFPSGPIPPCHAGTLSKGTAIAGSSGSTFIYPDGDVTLGSWTDQSGGTTLFDKIDEPHDTVNDADYIKVGPAINSTSEVSLQNPGFAPNQADAVKVVFRYSGNQPCTLTVAIVAASTVVTSQAIAIGSVPPVLYSSFTLSAANITTITGITSDWSDVRLRFTTSGSSALGFATIRQAYVQITASGQSSEGAWHGKDRFAYGIAYRFEDDSIWMPSTPRLPNATLPNGFNIFTVDAANADTAYDKITWNNLPVPPAGVKSKILLRTPKIDSTTEDSLAIDIFDLRATAEVAAAVTSYDDYAPDDDSLVLDVDELLIRFDHIMPPRARYIFAGDSRVCHSYGGQNPSALILAPVSIASDTTYDLNVADTSSTAYSTTAFYYQLSSSNLILSKDVAGTVTSTTFALSTYAKLQDLADAINATTIASNCGLWRCQLAPGVDPAAPTQTALCPTTRAITSITTTINQRTITAASGLSVVGVGSYVSGTGITAGTYVDRIDSDLQLHMSANATASGTVTLTFTSGTGDTLTGDTNQYLGRVRVIANSLPGFIYFNSTYLGTQTFDKSAIWMTVGSPLSSKSAPNCFSSKISNKFVPPSHAGISMGGRAVGGEGGNDQGFVVPFSRKRAAIRNTFGQGGSGADEDYRLFVTNESSGCCAWQSVTAGPRCVFMFSPEGWIVQDLTREYLISEATWRHPKSDADTGVGDYSYEAPQCIAATGQDNDSAYLIGQVINSALFVHYRTSGSTTHPDRQVVYDFSSGMDSDGIRATVRDPARGTAWGWSVPMQSAESGFKWFTAMTSARRSDGHHFYGWNEQNQGTGDGRIDELETGTTDNGTPISSLIATPWIRLGDDYLAGDKLITWHSTPAGASAQESFVRSTSLDAYGLTPSTSSTLVVTRDPKILPLGARTPAAACYVKWIQAGGTAREIRRATLYLNRIPIKGRGPSFA